MQEQTRIEEFNTYEQRYRFYDMDCWLVRFNPDGTIPSEGSNIVRLFRMMPLTEPIRSHGGCWYVSVYAKTEQQAIEKANGHLRIYLKTLEDAKFFKGDA